MTTVSRSALIYLPGIAVGTMDQSANGIADRIKTALNEGVCEQGDTFDVQDVGVYRYGQHKADSARVRRLRGGVEFGTLDVFVPTTVEERINRHRESRSWVRLAHVIVQLVLNLPRAGRLFTRRYANTDGWLALWAAIVLGTLSLYAVFLISGLIVAGIHMIPTVEAALADIPYLGPIVQSGITKVASFAVVLSAALGLSFIPKGWQSTVEESAAGWLMMLDHLNRTSSAATYNDPITALLASWADRAERSRDNVYIVGYSFGSVLALDAVFNKSVLPAHRSIRAVATIGCPCKALQVFWPGHFTARADPLDLEPRWFNVYIQGDPISTHFASAPERLGLRREGGAPIVPAQEFNQTDWGEKANAGPIGQFLLQGFTRLHSSYWDRTPGAPGCLRALLPAMLERDPIFAPPTTTDAPPER